MTDLLEPIPNALALLRADDEAHAKRALSVEFHGTSGDGRFTLEPVYCLGNCASGPSLMIDRELHGRMTPQRFDELISATEAVATSAAGSSA